MVDLDIVLLFGIKLLRTRRLAEFDVRGTRNDVGSRVRALVMGGEPVECAGQNHAEEKWSCEFHAFMKVPIS